MNSGREWTLVEVDVAVRGMSEEAETAIEWFWRNGYWVDRYADFIRQARVWCEQPRIRAVFERLRPPPPVRKDGLFPTLMDWLALSSALGKQGEILSWFDERVATGDTPLPQMHRLRGAILARGRLQDLLAFAEPLESAVDWIESVASTRENLADMPPDLLASELEQVDCEVALWRRVAEVARSDQLAELDAAIDASDRAERIRSWLAKTPAELSQALIEHGID